jgi:hypothetical protein
LIKPGNYYTVSCHIEWQHYVGKPIGVKIHLKSHFIPIEAPAQKSLEMLTEMVCEFSKMRFQEK